MNNYLLYGTALIGNDSTLKDFAKSLCDGVPVEDLSKADFKDEFCNLVYEILKFDISRTNINYEFLMYRYRSEIGDVMYERENQGCDMLPINFFGEEAQESFEFLVKAYIDIHFEELVPPPTTES